MSNKNKNNTNLILEDLHSKLTIATAHLGIILMSAATAIGLVEVPDHNKTQIVVPNRAVFAFATVNGSDNNPLRKEREDTAPHYISYAETMRTASRSGKH